MSILVATDFSPCSQVALRLGAALARRQSAPLVVVHTVERPPVDATAIPIGLSGWEGELLASAEARLAREVGPLEDEGLVVEKRVWLGSPSELIRDAITSARPELVVMGTHGRKGAARFFLGSVAEHVVRAAECPVLVTGERAPEPSDLARWAGEAPLRLALASDGSAASRSAFAWMHGFEASRACELTIVHLYWPAEAALRYGLDDPWGGQPRGPELGQLVERDLRRDAQAALGRVPPLRLRIAAHDAAEALSEECAQLGVDAMVVGVPRRRSARWAVVTPAAVLRSASVPILCVPASAAAPARELPRTTSILVPTDFSEASREAILPAYGLLQAGGGHVELCTVHLLAPPRVPEAAPGPGLTEDERRGALARLHALVPPEAEAAGITTTVSVLEGRSVAEAILAAAERLGVDLVALGSRGRSGLRRAVLGSVAEEVTRRSPRPVLVVGDPRERT
jgi:nucleotide-binding universal stress UspA family protein